MSQINSLEEIYRWEEYTLHVAGIPFKMLDILNFDEVFEEMMRRDPEDPVVQDERMPYWMELWPSALALAEHILRRAPVSPASRVVEIGCGLALPSLAAAHHGAQVIISDYLPEALAFAARIWELNRREKPQTLLWDWRTDYTQDKVDILLGSDLAYETRNFEPLLHTFRRMLAPTGVVLLSEPNRLLAKPFFDLLEKSGYNFTKTEYAIDHKGLTTRVGVYELSLQKAVLNTVA